MKNSPPNEEDNMTVETVENSQDSLNAGTNNDSVIDLGEFVANTIELVSSFFDD